MAILIDGIPAHEIGQLVQRHSQQRNAGTAMSREIAWCYECKVERPATEFVALSTSRRGYAGICKRHDRRPAL